MTAIDSGHIGQCASCGAAVMPQNQPRRAGWHGELRRRLQELEDRLRDLDRRATGLED